MEVVTTSGKPEVKEAPKIEDSDAYDEKTASALDHLQLLSKQQRLIMLKSSDLQAYKQHSVLFNPRNDYGQSFATGVQRLKPTHIMTFKTQLTKVEIVSRQQIILQTQSQIFVYRFVNSDCFGQCVFQFSLKNSLLYAYQLDRTGFIAKFAIALDRMTLAVGGKQAFDFENEKMVQVFAYNYSRETLVKEFEIRCNERNAMSAPGNWPPADMKFDEEGKRLVMVNK